MNSIYSDAMWGGPEDPTDHKVLMTLADFANHDGQACYPSIELIAKLTRLKERTIIRSIKALVKDCWLKILVKGNGAGHITAYEVDTERLMENARAQRDAWKKRRRKKRLSMPTFPQKGDSDDMQRVTLTTEKGDSDDMQRVTLTTEKGDSDDTHPRSYVFNQVLEPNTEQTTARARPLAPRHQSQNPPPRPQPPPPPRIPEPEHLPGPIDEVYQRYRIGRKTFDVRLVTPRECFHVEQALREYRQQEERENARNESSQSAVHRSRESEAPWLEKSNFGADQKHFSGPN